MKGINNWIGKYVDTKFGPYLLGILAFFEGILPIPTSSLLAFYCLHNKNKAFIYALSLTVISLFSAFFGYLMGSIFWESFGKNLIIFFKAQELFNKVMNFYKDYQGFTIFFSIIVPIPFKLLTIGAGVGKFPLLKFLIYSSIARGIRFFAIATSIYIWGEKVNSLLKRYFYYIIILGIILFILIWLIFDKLIYVYL